MEYLKMSLEDLKLSNLGIDKVTVGAGILRRDYDGVKILLLKRNANGVYHPSVFEMPGGKVDATDSTIRSAIVREVAEETSLAVANVIAPISRMRYTTEKQEKDASGHENIVKSSALQLSYIVTVKEGTEFKVNPEEHSMGVWADRETLDRLRVNPEMKELVTEVLNWADDNSAELQKIHVEGDKSFLRLL